MGKHRSHILKQIRSKHFEKHNKTLIDSVLKSEKKQTEIALPRYQFCGPGTKVLTRMLRGEKGINELDAGCREHDVAYFKYAGDSRELKKSDQRLREVAKRVGGLSGFVVDKTFALKNMAENIGLIDPVKFASALSQHSIEDQRKIGNYLYNKYLND